MLWRVFRPRTGRRGAARRGAAMGPVSAEEVLDELSVFELRCEGDEVPGKRECGGPDPGGLGYRKWAGGLRVGRGGQRCLEVPGVGERGGQSGPGSATKGMEESLDLLRLCPNPLGRGVASAR